MRTALTSLVLVSAMLAACGEVEQRPETFADAMEPDAMRGVLVPDAEPATCQATGNYGAATAGDQQAYADAPRSPMQVQLLGALNADATPDMIDLQLYKGYGAYAAGEIVPGTFDISGVELDFATCGVCVLIHADVAETGEPGSTYLATSGTVTITSVSPNLTGTLSNVFFEHVTIDPTNASSTPHADGCASALSSLSFDAAVAAQ